MNKIDWGFLTAWLGIMMLTLAFWSVVIKIIVDLVT